MANKTNLGTEVSAIDCTLWAGWAEEPTALAFRAACLLSAVSLRRCPVESGPLVTRLQLLEN